MATCFGHITVILRPIISKIQKYTLNLYRYIGQFTYCCTNERFRMTVIWPKHVVIK